MILIVIANSFWKHHFLNPLLFFQIPCCPQFSIHTGVSWNGTFRDDVEDFITVDGTSEVTSSGNVTLAAENQINFLPGFNVQAGGQLDAFLQNCLYGPRLMQGRERPSWSIDHSQISKEVLKGGINIYPNPSNDGVFTVRCDNQIGQVLVYDAIGKVILRKESDTFHHVLDLTTQDKGVYIVEIHTEQKIWKERLVIQ